MMNVIKKKIKMLSKIFKKNKNTKLSTIDKFQAKSDLLITYEDLKKIKLNEVQQIVKSLPGAIECIRISSINKDSLMFTVTMKANQLWEKHHHDCEETCVVYKGKLIDALTGYDAGPAELLNFKPYQPHYVIAEEDTIFYVEFKKPNK